MPSKATKKGVKPGAKPKPKKPTKSAGKKPGLSGVQKFAGGVNSNFQKGLKKATTGLDRAIPSRPASSSVSKASKDSPAARAALKRAIGK